MSVIKSKLSEYREDKKAPNKNLPIIKDTFKTIKEIFDSKLSDLIPKQMIEEAENSLPEIEAIAKLRTQSRTIKLVKIAELAKLITPFLMKENIDLYIKVQITNFLMEIKLAPDEMKNSPIPNLLSGILGIGIAFFPVWSYIAIIIGGYHLLSRDYRNRLFGFIILFMVIIGFLVNYFYFL